MNKITLNGNEEIIKSIQNQRTQFKKGDSKLDIIAEYFISCLNEYNIIKDYLPEKINNILDIGCGIGGPTLCLLKNRLDIQGTAYLLDKDEIEPRIKYGYSDATSAYNKKKNTLDFFYDNGIVSGKIEYVETFPTRVFFDVVTSYISCGFHYPITTYLSDIVKKIKKSGVVILDIRKDTGQINILRDYFMEVAVIYTGEKHEKVLCQKKR